MGGIGNNERNSTVKESERLEKKKLQVLGNIESGPER